jgi:hypothetical protein
MSKHACEVRWQSPCEPAACHAMTNGGIGPVWLYLQHISTHAAFGHFTLGAA